MVICKCDHQRCWWCWSETNVIVCDEISFMSLLCGSSSVSGREETEPLISLYKGCSELLGSSMKMDGKLPSLVADPVWWTIDG